MKSNEQKKSIICFITENIGDTISASGVIEFFNFHYDSHFVCTEYNKEILQLCGIRNEKIITLRRDPGFLDLITIVKENRFYKWDTAVVLDYTSVKDFAILASKISGIRNIIYKNFTEADFDELRNHAEAKNFDILTVAKYLIAKDLFDLPLMKQIKFYSSDKFYDYKDYIGIHVGGFGSILYPVSRKYPDEYTFELIKHLLEKGYRVLITGDEFDRKSFMKFSEELSKYEGFLDLAGKLTISELASLLKNIRVYITPDNGTLHLAQAVGCSNIIALIGPTSPYLVKGKDTNILRVELPCSPCLQFLKFPKRCINSRDHQCLWDLKPEKVVDEIINSLSYRS